MKLVIDETLGNFQAENLVIKPVNTKNGPKPIGEIIKDKESKLLSRSLGIIESSQLDQIQFFKNLTDAYEIVYFYDPGYTDINMIRRLKNWLYPEQSLNCYPIFHNRATLYMLLDKLSRASHESSSLITSRIAQYSSTIQEWIITPDPKAFYKNNIKSIYKKTNKPFRILVSENGKAKIEKTGSLNELVDSVLGRNDVDSSQTWLVSKDLSNDLSVNDHDKTLRVRKAQSTCQCTLCTYSNPTYLELME
ncbi:hypothetical protein ACJROX_02055 [Pseudalkalibacillus sp. A8]|uniref:hypothetical protein n=1 Tax=Pseudalkalibacillus sp. A8 TaxID=3382641 RepID=UPI0038B51CAE